MERCRDWGAEWGGSWQEEIGRVLGEEGEGEWWMRMVERERGKREKGGGGGEGKERKRSKRAIAGTPSNETMLRYDRTPLTSCRKTSTIRI